MVDQEDDEGGALLRPSHRTIDQLQRPRSATPTSRLNSGNTQDKIKQGTMSSKYSAASLDAMLVKPSPTGFVEIDDIEFEEGPADDDSESSPEPELALYAGPKNKTYRYRITAPNIPQGGSKRPRKEVTSAVFVTSQLPLHFK